MTIVFKKKSYNEFENMNNCYIIQQEKLKLCFKTSSIIIKQ